jgi:hypothetical protein
VPKGLPDAGSCAAVLHWTPSNRSDTISANAWNQPGKEGNMIILAVIWAIVVLLVAFWAIGFFILHIGFFIWVALILAMIGAVYGMLTDRRTVR